MRALVLIHADIESAGMDRFERDLVQAGVLLAADRLHPATDAVRVRLADGPRAVVIERSIESAAGVTGFWLWQVRSLDEAIEWAMRAPDPLGAGEIEIREVLDPRDHDGAGRYAALNRHEGDPP